MGLPHHGFGRAPPAIKGTRLAILQPTYFVAAAQDFFAWWRLQEGYHLQHVKKLADDPIWLKDPKMTAFREELKYGLNMGYAGPPGEKASLALSKYIVVDTFAKAVQSGDPAGTIKWGADQLQRLYG